MHFIDSCLALFDHIFAEPIERLLVTLSIWPDTNAGSQHFNRMQVNIIAFEKSFLTVPHVGCLTSKMDTESFIEAIRIPAGQNNRVKSLAFSDCGKYLVTSVSNNEIVVYDCDQSMLSTTIRTAKYGNGIVRFADSAKQVLQTSSKVDNVVRLIDVEKHAFQRYFDGHSDEVLSLDFAPNNNKFITASKDGTVKLWDPRSDKVRHTIKSLGEPVACMHAVTKIMAIGSNSETIELYDEGMEKGPFSSFQVAKYTANWRSIQFSRKGDYVAIGTDETLVHLVNTYDGGVETFRSKFSAVLGWSFHRRKTGSIASK